MTTHEETLEQFRNLSEADVLELYEDFTSSYSDDWLEFLDRKLTALLDD